LVARGLLSIFLVFIFLIILLLFAFVFWEEVADSFFGGCDTLWLSACCLDEMGTSSKGAF